MIIPATSTGTRVAWTAKASSASILDRPLKSTGRSARGDVFADVPIFLDFRAYAAMSAQARRRMLISVGVAG